MEWKATPYDLWAAAATFGDCQKCARAGLVKDDLCYGCQKIKEEADEAVQ